MTNLEKFEAASNLLVATHAAEYADTTDQYVFAENLIEQHLDVWVREWMVASLEDRFDAHNEAHQAAKLKNVYIVTTIDGDLISTRNSEPFARNDAKKSGKRCTIVRALIAEVIEV